MPGLVTGLVTVLVTVLVTGPLRYSALSMATGAPKRRSMRARNSSLGDTFQVSPSHSTVSG
jgi:hypothetical protein